MMIMDKTMMMRVMRMNMTLKTSIKKKFSISKMLSDLMYTTCDHNKTSMDFSITLDNLLEQQLNQVPAMYWFQKMIKKVSQCLS
jgi:hypothetical protein